MSKAWIFGRLVITTTKQSGGAPFVDECGGQTIEGRSWRGRAVLLNPWRKDRYGDRLPGLALCLGWLT